MYHAERLFKPREGALLRLALPCATPIAKEHDSTVARRQPSLAGDTTPWLEHELPEPPRPLAPLERVLHRLLVSFAMTPPGALAGRKMPGQITRSEIDEEIKKREEYSIQRQREIDEAKQANSTPSGQRRRPPRTS